MIRVFRTWLWERRCARAYERSLGHKQPWYRTW